MDKSRGVSFCDRKSLHIRYLLEPRQLFGIDKIQKLRFEGTKFSSSMSTIETPSQLQSMSVEGTNKFVEEQYDLVIPSIGYFPADSFGLETDQKGIILNQNGLVCGEKHLYVTGWAATGPHGNISKTMHHATTVADQMMRDFSERSSKIKVNREVEDVLKERGISPMTKLLYSSKS